MCKKVFGILVAITELGLMRFYSIRGLLSGLIMISVFLTSCSSKRILSDSSTRPAVVKGSLSARYSAILGVKEKAIKNEKLYRFIDGWMGVPHRLGGMDKKGVDCSGFIS